MNTLFELSYVIENGRLPIREDIKTKLSDAVKQLYRLGITNILSSMGVSDIEEFILNADESTFSKAKSNLAKIGMVESIVIKEGFLDFFKGQNKNVLIMTAIMALVGLTGDAHAGWGLEDFKNAASNVATQTQKALTSPEAKAIGKSVADATVAGAKGTYDAATSKEAKALGKATFDATIAAGKALADVAIAGAKGTYDAATSKEAKALGKASGDVAVASAKGAYSAATSPEAKALGKSALRGTEVGAEATGKFAADQASKLPEKYEVMKDAVKKKIDDIKYDMAQRDLKKRAERQAVADQVIGKLFMPRDSLNNVVDLDSAAYQAHMDSVMSSVLTSFVDSVKSEMKRGAEAERAAHPEKRFPF